MGKLKNDRLPSSNNFIKKLPGIFTRNNQVVLSSLLIIFVSTLAYLPLIPFMGFYSEDFFFSYVGHFYGLNGLISSNAIDRPLDGYLMALGHLIFDDNVFLWHLSTFILRLTGSFILFFAIKKIWPDKLWVTTSMTLLFLIYPGYLQQTLPLGYQVYPIGLVFWTGSLFFNLAAIKSQKMLSTISFTLTALFLQILAFLNLEFFIGMEALRMLLIIYVLQNNSIEFTLKAIKKSLRFWRYLSPYFIGMMIFILWRVFIFNSTREVTDINWIAQNYYSNPIWIIKIPLEIVYSWVSTIILPYFFPILIRIPRIPLESSIISFSVGIVSAILLYYYFKIIKGSRYDTDSNSSVRIKKFGKELLIIGLISVFGALIPIIFLGRFVRLYNVFDRYTITSIIAVSFIIVGFLFFKTSSRIRNHIIILLVTLSVTTHLMNGYLFATNWDKQKDIWWQLYWRAPKIQNNTMLIFDFPPLTKDSLFKGIINKVQWYRIYWVDYQIWMAGNLFFNYDNSPQNHFGGDFLSAKNVVQKIKNKVIENREARNITYTRNFNNTVIITTPNDSSCLWVLDGYEQELPDNSSRLLESNITYSNIDKLVQKDKKAAPPVQIFGHEPSRSWCYYFQKASLSRQFENWEILDQLTQEVLRKNLKPNDINEWLPFIEGLIVAKKYSQADSLIKAALKNNSDTFMENICKMTKRLQTIEFDIYCQS